MTEFELEPDVAIDDNQVLKQPIVDLNYVEPSPLTEVKNNFWNPLTPHEELS